MKKRDEDMVGQGIGNQTTADGKALPSSKTLKGLRKKGDMMAERGIGELLCRVLLPAPPNSPWRAMTSTSITAQPSCWNTWITELLPEAMPPVRPTRNIFPGDRRPVRMPNQESRNHRSRARLAGWDAPSQECQKDLPGDNSGPDEC